MHTQDLFSGSSLNHWVLIFITNLVRYVVVAGIPFLIFYVWKKGILNSSKIQPKFPKVSDYQREILYSVLTFCIFGLVAVALFHPAVRPHTFLYKNWNDYGTGYGILSFFLLIFLHDTYFYWTHRAMHHPLLYKAFHKTHHLSTNPSPWASFSFSPLEAVVEAGIFPVAVFLFPLHAYVILAFLFFMTAYNVYGHLGWELYPRWVLGSPLFKWLNTSVSHNQHHQYFKGNYGLYFRFWDEALHTTRSDYAMAFEQQKRLN